MRICLISTEIFAWGKYGGFGRATRLIGRELVKRGLDVFAVVPRRSGQKSFEILDGIKVYGFSPYSPWAAKKIFAQCDAHIYHSCEPSYGTYLAMKTMPHRKHMVTFRDPRDAHDWKMEFDLPSLNRLQVVHNYIYENNWLVRRCIRRMDAVYTIGKYLVPKVKTMYKLKTMPQFLPTPVSVPAKVEKSPTPTVCYAARLDRRKRPKLFCDLAQAFPYVKFITMGKSRDKRWESHLKQEYCHLPNLEFVGFINQFESDQHSRILEKSWIMVNTATREALPNAFIEAAAFECALLSQVDPDNFASAFGYHAAEDNFEEGLQFLLENNNWQKLGTKGAAYIRETFELNRSIDLHLQQYATVLGN